MSYVGMKGTEGLRKSDNTSRREPEVQCVLETIEELRTVIRRKDLRVKHVDSYKRLIKLGASLSSRHQTTSAFRPRTEFSPSCPKYHGE
jgi:hypothetical protein